MIYFPFLNAIHINLISLIKKTLPSVSLGSAEFPVDILAWLLSLILHKYENRNSINAEV